MVVLRSVRCYGMNEKCRPNHIGVITDLLWTGRKMFSSFMLFLVNMVRLG
jgi:hypothetical protein